MNEPDDPSRRPSERSWLDDIDAATPPVAPRRASRRAPRTATRARARASRRASRPSARGGYWARRLGALAGLAAIVAALLLINAIFQPFHGSGSGAVDVSIPQGADAGAIGRLLAKRGVVSSGRFFELNATLTLRRGKLRSGDYTLARDMSNGDAIEALMQGPKAKVVKTFEVTLPEGRSRRELAPLVRRAGVKGSYLAATASPALRKRAQRFGLPRSARTLEGFLFPATYELVEGATASTLARRQLAAFGRALATLDLSRARRGNLTRYDVVIIASMVEREASVARERPLIAAVIYNRLQQGIPLGIDATIRYAENNWSRPLLDSQLRRPGPYNTRLNTGLPPTPIGNPGLASLKAAARPANVDYLYYVVKPCGKGAHTFTDSYSAFLAASRRYEAERARLGGRSPTDC
jgi:uncharacterized YceG family protein